MTYQINSEGVIPIFIKVDNYYQMIDEDFKEIIENKNSRKLLLDSLGVGSIIVNRIGIPKENGKFLSYGDEVNSRLVGDLV